MSNFRSVATSRLPRSFTLPVDHRGIMKKVSDYYAELTFDYKRAEDITDATKREISDLLSKGQAIKKEHAEAVAKAVMAWAIKNGATHFCHWFQPLTGSTAEKHDAFFQLKNHMAIEKLSAGQLMQGEPDASSFPNGGTRSTFEARGYTTWDLTSPMFLVESTNGKTLCIPTAFVSYHGDALDVKTPLLRSITLLSDAATKFLNETGSKATSVIATCGAEQEYFLVDKAFYFARPDLVMTGRTLFGALTTRHQQLEDHYFAMIPERVLAFMQELDYELHRLGIPAKTRHNEVAPAQFELAPIFCEANIAADQNQLMMTTMRRIAEKHNFMVLLHEKPFTGINGSGKHVNWSMSDQLGNNLLEPGEGPHQNYCFLATVAVIMKAVHKYSDMLRASISGAGNDHRLGANEAPPSIISIYLGDTLDKIFRAVLENKNFSPNEIAPIQLGAFQLADLSRDNTDRNRTSPFAFTGNKFEFRAVGSSQAIGFPLTVLNTAVADIFNEATVFLAQKKLEGIGIDQALTLLIKSYTDSSYSVVFNGDGYSKEWREEAIKRKLNNWATTPEALERMKHESVTSFMSKNNVLSKGEIDMRYTILLERYIKLREIELETLIDMAQQSVIPAALKYKKLLAKILKNQQAFNVSSVFELATFKKITQKVDEVYNTCLSLQLDLKSGNHIDHQIWANKIASELMPKSQMIALYLSELEEMISDSEYPLPKYYDMLFLR